MAGCLLSRGNAFPPLFHAMIGMALVPTAAEFIGLRFKRRRTAELAVLFLGGVTCFALAYGTPRPPQNRVFEVIFKTRPSASVKNLRTRAQWFDGMMQFADFEMPETEFEELVRSAGLRPDPNGSPSAESDPDFLQNFAQSRWQQRVGQWGRIAYDFWPRDTRVSSIQVYGRLDDANQGTTSVVRESASSHVWAVKLSD